MNNKGGNDYERKFEQKKHGIQKDVLPNVYGSEVVTIENQKFVKFSVDSFSPFALLYEKENS